MSNEVILEDVANEVLTSPEDVSSSDELSVDANLEEIEAYLAGDHPSEDGDVEAGVSEEDQVEEVAEKVVEEESQLEENQPEENQVSDETDESGDDSDDGYYSMEDFLGLAEDDIIDGKFDSNKVKPGSAVAKFVKGFERAQTKKFTEVAELRKDLEARIDALSNKKEFDPDEFFSKQKQFADEEKRIAEQESLMTDEELVEHRGKIALAKKQAELERENEAIKNDLNQLRVEASQRNIENQIAKYSSKFNIDLDDNDTYVNVNKEIGKVWDVDARNGKQPQDFTPIHDIIENLAGVMETESSKYISKDNLKEFWDSDEGKKLIKQKLNDELAAVRKMKKAGGKVIPTSSKDTPVNENIDSGVDLAKMSDDELQDWLSGEG